MRSIQQVLGTGALVVSGAVCGVLVVTVLRSGDVSTEKDASKVDVPIAHHIDDPVVDTAALQARIERLETEVTRRMTVPIAQAREPREETGEAHVEHPNPDAELTQFRAEALRNELNRAFEEEQADHQWATDAARVFHSDLQALEAVGQYTVEMVECRTSKCRAKVRWPTYDKAHANCIKLLYQSFSNNCAIHVAVPEPSDRAAAYSGEVHFDCSELRDSK
jgi:hypothetical protein